MMNQPQQPINAITVDVEDWVQSVLDPNSPLTDRFVHNTHTILELFSRFDVKATFFVLGLAAKKAPQLVRDIQRAGHEIQSHGYGHQLITKQTSDAFREDVTRSKKLLEDITGQRVTGYRAPAFSVVEKTMWALDVLLDCEFEYDSSIFPLEMKRYGIDGTPCRPHRVTAPSGREILEIPVAAGRMWGIKTPVGGGGYIRLLPYSLIRSGLRKINRFDQPFTLYMHPYEFAPNELNELPQRIPLKLKWHQGLGRSGFAGKIERLLADFQFNTVSHIIKEQKMIPACAPASESNPAPTVCATPS